MALAFLYSSEFPVTAMELVVRCKSPMGVHFICLSGQLSSKEISVQTVQ